MAYSVSNNWNTKVSSENNLKYVPYLLIDNTYIPANQISKIDFIEDIIDKENQYMYIGTFRSNQMDVTFKTLPEMEITSNLPVYCEVGLNTDYQAIDFTYSGTDQNGYKLFTIDNEEDMEYFKEHYYVNIVITNGEDVAKYERLEILEIDTTGSNSVFTIDLYQVSTIPLGATITIYPFEYVPKGYYLVDDPEENYYKKCKLTCLDYGIKLKPAVDYSSAFVNGKITLENLLIWLCNHFNVTLGTYPNVNNNIEIGVYDSTLSGKTFVSYIAEMFGGNVKFDRNGALNIIPLKQNSTKTINALKTKSFDLGEKYKISKVVYQDAIRIFDAGTDTDNTLFIRPENMFVPDNTSITNIYNAVKDFEIYSLKNEMKSDLSIDSWDIVTYSVGEDNYLTYYNNTTTYNMTPTTKVETKIPSKQQEITTNVINANIDTKMSVVKTTIDLLNATIQLLSERVIDVSNTVSGTGSITLSNAYPDTLHHLEITGNISLTFPNNDIYPSNTLYPLDSYLLVDTTKYHLAFNILRFISSDVCDKYVYEDGKQWIERNVGVDGQGNLYQLSETVIEEKEDIDIKVNSDSTIHLESFNNAHYSCTYLLENEYTNNFATKVDVASEINIKAGEIEEKVSSVADQDGNVTSASIVLAINNDTSSTTINADKIKLEGYTTINDGFSIDMEGNMTANNGTFTGGELELKSQKDTPKAKISTINEALNLELYGNGFTIYDNDTPAPNEYSYFMQDANEAGLLLTPTNYYFNNDKYIYGYIDNSSSYLKVSASSNSYCNYNQTGAHPSSDKRCKENIENISKEKSLDIIKELNPVEYNYIGLKDKHRGLIAQDVKETLEKNGIKNQIYEYDKEKDRYSLNYTEFIPDLINCIKYQQEQIEKLQKRIEILERNDK